MRRTKLAMSTKQSSRFHHVNESSVESERLKIEKIELVYRPLKAVKSKVTSLDKQRATPRKRKNLCKLNKNSNSHSKSHDGGGNESIINFTRVELCLNNEQMSLAKIFYVWFAWVGIVNWSIETAWGQRSTEKRPSSSLPNSFLAKHVKLIWLRLGRCLIYCRLFDFAVHQRTRVLDESIFRCATKESTVIPAKSISLR